LAHSRYRLSARRFCVPIILRKQKITLMPEIKSVLFDMDGVLVSAKEWHYEAFNKALEFFGFQPISREDHLARYDGLPTLKKLVLAASEQNIPASMFKAISDKKQELTLDVARVACVPNPEHVLMLKQLAMEGYAMAVCSNSVRASVDMLLNNTGIMGFFPFTLSNEDVKNPKPHPEMYNTAMLRLGVNPQETLILEDNHNGIAAARASGAYVLEIGDISEVNYDAIHNAILSIKSSAV
jgi:HAD superfamily hydrolase (TIGR01509 family)